MCRMLGLLDPRGDSAELWLVGTDRSLLKQSNAQPTQLQADGWGVAWYEDSPDPRVIKGTESVFSPSGADRFRDAARRASGRLVIGHVRRASNPMGLSHDRLIALENSQPFVHGSIAFAHNGVVPFPRATRRLLGRFEENVQGVNDSEVLFWLLVRHLDEGHDPLEAYARTVADLVEVWKDQGAPATGPYSGLNVLLATGPNDLWAFCHYRGEHGGALLDRTRPYFDFAYTTDSHRLLIGSEPLGPSVDGWKDVRNGQFLHAHAASGLVAARTGTIPVSLTRPARP
jgi:predicted glutamine amidotransferase